jgi:HK97 family phage prohead protease
MENRFMPLDQIEIRAAGARGIEGYAALFDCPARIGDKYEEVIRPGAFTRSLAAGTDIIATRDHDTAQLLARTSGGSLTLSQDSAGLHFRISELPSTGYANDLKALLAGGLLGGASFTFGVNAKVGDADVWQRDGKSRELRAVTLFEIALVTSHAAYPATAATIHARSAAAVDTRAVMLRRLALAMV